MIQDLQYILILGFAFLVLFGFAEILHHKFKVDAELTRKTVHLGTGLLTLLFPLMLTSYWSVLALCSSFAVILLLSKRFNFLKSINAVPRTTHGSILYPLAVFLAFLMSYTQHNTLYFYIPILILAICDTLASLCGQKWPWGKFKIMGNCKSLSGCMAFFISSFLIIYPFLLANNLQNAFFISIAVALSTTLSEALTGKGFDNITVPLTAMASLYWLV